MANIMLTYIFGTPLKRTRGKSVLGPLKGDVDRLECLILRIDVVFPVCPKAGCHGRERALRAPHGGHRPDTIGRER